MPEEVRTIVSGVRIKLEHVGKGMKSTRGESVLIDVGESTHRATVADAQQIEIIRMLAIRSEYGNGVEPRAVVMKLSFQARILARIEKVPESARATVVTPMRQRRHVSQNGIESNLGFFFKAEELGPGIDFFLASRIPRHLAAKRIRLLLPAIRALAHLRVETLGFRRHVLAAKIVDKLHEDVAFHLPESGIAGGVFRHRHRRFVGMRQIPAPVMVRD